MGWLPLRFGIGIVEDKPTKFSCRHTQAESDIISNSCFESSDIILKYRRVMVQVHGRECSTLVVGHPLVVSEPN